MVSERIISKFLEKFSPIILWWTFKINPKADQSFGIPCIFFDVLKQILRNPRNCSDQKLKMRFEGVFECFLPIFDLENTILGLFPGVFKSRFGYRVRGSNFKSHSYIPNCISYCSVRGAESIGANIFQIWPSYHKLRLKTVQKCQKAWVVEEKAKFTYIVVCITSQYFHRTKYMSYSC